MSSPSFFLHGFELAFEFLFKFTFFLFFFFLLHFCLINFQTLEWPAPGSPSFCHTSLKSPISHSHTLNSQDSSMMTSSLLCSPRMGLPISKILWASSSSGVGMPVRYKRNVTFLIYCAVCTQLKPIQLLRPNSEFCTSPSSVEFLTVCKCLCHGGKNRYLLWPDIYFKEPLISHRLISFYRTAWDKAKWKADLENWMFNNEWTEKYVFIAVGANPLCLVSCHMKRV